PATAVTVGCAAAQAGADSPSATPARMAASAAGHLLMPFNIAPPPVDPAPSLAASVAGEHDQCGAGARQELLGGGPVGFGHAARRIGRGGSGLGRRFRAARQHAPGLTDMALGPLKALAHVLDRRGGRAVVVFGRETTLFYRGLLHSVPTHRECVEFPTVRNKRLTRRPGAQAPRRIVHVAQCKSKKPVRAASSPRLSLGGPSCPSTAVIFSME